MTETKTIASEWYNQKWLVAVLYVFVFPLGLYAIWKGDYRQGWKIGLSILALFMVLVVLTERDKKKQGRTHTIATEVETEPTRQVKLGEILNMDYFEVRVNKAWISDRVSTGNEFADLPPEHGVSYLVIDATFKNVDTESRVIMDGSVWVETGEKWYEYDKSETVLAKGWGLIFEQINPLTEKRTKLVYKIPESLRGNFEWQPGRADRDQTIFLGGIK